MATHPWSPARHTIAGSERSALPGATATGDVTPDERFEVTLRLRSKSPLQAHPDDGTQKDVPPAQRHYLSRDAYAQRHDTDAQDIQKVTDFAKAQGLAVVDTNAARRSVVLSGTASTLGAAFGVALQQFEHDGGSYRGRVGSISVPADLADVVEGVFGLDNRPAASPHFQVLGGAPGSSDQGQDAVNTRAGSTNTAFTPPQLASLYKFPTGLDGHGQCIGIIELGGGFKPADITSYFTGLGLPVPTVKAISVDGGTNHPTNANSADGEVMLDIEVAAAIAPKATIAVYFAPNTSKGFLDAITMAVHDSVNKPSVISISWGGRESSWTAQAMTQYDQSFQAAASMGVTVCCAAGDNGSGDGVADGKAHVDFPASSPYVLGCGGTRIAGSGSTITSEVVWNAATNSATGGGVSMQFGLPAYQKNAKVPVAAGGGHHVGRGVPDVAGDADPASGYRVRVDGQNMVIGGTSAVAPLWAGLIALMNQKLGHPVGFLNPLLYGSLVSKGVFNDITSGNNGAYAAKAGWDPCTGWGTPIGNKLLQALGG